MNGKTVDMKKAPDISIVVSCWNAGEIIEEALDSIVATDGSMNIDVTIIDDASTDGGVAQIFKKYKNDSRFSLVLNETNVGQSALNIMLERSRAKYIMTFDTDARMKPGTLQALFAFMESHPEAGAATANLCNADGSPQLYYRRLTTPLMFFFMTTFGRAIDKYLLGLRYYKWYRYSDLDITRVSELEQPPIACLILRRDALGSRIFDTDFKLFMIDVDLCKRIYDKGYKIYFIPEAKVIHLKTASASKRGKKWLDHELNRSFMVYFRKHHPLSVPLLWVVWHMDRLMRTLLLRTVGREPMR